MARSLTLAIPQELTSAVSVTKASGLINALARLAVRFGVLVFVLFVFISSTFQVHHGKRRDDSRCAKQVHFNAAKQQPYHLVLFDQYAADILPLAMFLA